MNNGREKGSRKKPEKSRREGYTGKRKQKEKERAIRLSKAKDEKRPSAFILELQKRLNRIRSGN